ncbi:hypothetical protein [Nonomuraea jiangxiensis]|uniref:hypothetical protein n=1 Tax=Nonomuraea jiangxiensis TaxID=633440 RepID=UPI0015A350EB|nr:hypothetical protein [Nonomuraea jiangxiensis]
MAELTGLPRALAIPALLAAFVALTATALRVRMGEQAQRAKDRASGPCRPRACAAA